MALKKYKPITAGTRWRIGNAYAEITSDAPEKTLLEKISRTGGRNSQGRRAMRYIGGGHKKMYRLIDFKRDKKDIQGKVVSIEWKNLANALRSTHFLFLLLDFYSFLRRALNYSKYFAKFLR